MADAPVRVDLHLHTTASDGQLAPSALVRLAQAQRLDVIAITDHDTTAGLAEAEQAAGGLPVIILGIELSAEDARLDVHVLGYFFDAQDEAFQAVLARFRDDRERRGQKIVVKLAELGLPVAWERVLALANGGAVGRPHVARALVEAGYVESVKEAFDRFLYTGGPAYVPRERLTPEGAIDLIHGAGGAAVLAHPGLLPDYAVMVVRLVSAGLDGVEVAHPKNSETVRANLRALAGHYGLVMTGGSDYHGPESDAAIGSVTPPPGCTEALRERAAKYQNTR
ncbi:MAG: PHP domain-containing protein [Chloroflexi bacterium]|nr:PHP domain-containing protein [Chloroflexota bacterium]